MFRYEIRRWPNGRVPDIDEAVDSPQRLSADPATAARLLERVSTLTWGREPLATGDTWNSNSVVSWLLVRSGIDPAAARLPAHGQAPGWRAGLAVAGSDHRSRDARHRAPEGAQADEVMQPPGRPEEDTARWLRARRITLPAADPAIAPVSRMFVP